MSKVLVVGAGKIGRRIAGVLSDSGVEVTVLDQELRALSAVEGRMRTVLRDFRSPGQLNGVMRGHDAVISAVYHTSNSEVAQAALETGVSYFDLTEDVASTRQIMELAARARAGQIFMPQCGLAPGFVSIVAGDIASRLDTVDTLHLRVGALPQFPENHLRYNLTWSTDGLVNEYCNPCDAIVDHERVTVQPLDGVEHFSLEGINYEAFNTSGGLGTLAESMCGKVRELNYKTLRYPGHRDLMQFLLHDLKFKYNRQDLIDLLDTNLPTTRQDVVVTFCTATGWKGTRYVHLTDCRQIHGDEFWTAIQVTTAAGVCAVVDLFLHGKIAGTGLIRQEQVSLDDFLSSHFGCAYHSPVRRFAA